MADLNERINGIWGREKGDRANTECTRKEAELKYVVICVVRDEPNDSAVPEPALAEKFIELMCEHEPERVCDFLRTNQLYREDVAIEV